MQLTKRNGRCKVNNTKTAYETYAVFVLMTEWRVKSGEWSWRPPLEVSPIVSGVKAFPYEGKGDHVVVDEVWMDAGG